MSLLTLLLPLAGIGAMLFAAYLLGIRHGYDDGYTRAYDEVEAWQAEQDRRLRR